MLRRTVGAISNGVNFEMKGQVRYNSATMLLKYLRKKTRAILIGTLILIIPAFIFLYGWSRLSNRDRIPYIIAKVGRTPITWEEYQNELQRYINLLGNSYAPENKKQIETQILNNIIERYLLIEETKKRNIKIDDNEIIQQIQAQEIFKNEEGKFDRERFRLITERFPEAINTLEKDLRLQIAIEKLMAQISGSAEISEDEAYEYFLTSNAKVKIKYIALRPDYFKKNVETNEQELKNYYEEHKSFKDGPWRKIEYVLIDEKQIEDIEIKPAPEKIEEQYSQYMAQTTDTGIVTAEIKNKIEKDLKQKEKEILLKDKAWNISDKLWSEKNWNSFAQNESLLYDTTGYFAKGEPIPEFNIRTTATINQTAFSLPFNETSEPIKSEKGYVIIRPLHEEPKYEEIEDKINTIVIDNKVKDIIKKTKEKIASELQNDTKIEDIAGEYSANLEESDYFSRYGLIKGIGYAPEVTQKAFSQNKGETDIAVTASDTIYVIQTIDKKDPSREEFREAKERITNILLYRKKQQVFSEWLDKLKKDNEDRISILWDELK